MSFWIFPSWQKSTSLFGKFRVVYLVFNSTLADSKRRVGFHPTMVGKLPTQCTRRPGFSPAPPASSHPPHIHPPVQHPHPRRRILAEDHHMPPVIPRRAGQTLTDRETASATP